MTGFSPKVISSIDVSHINGEVGINCHGFAVMNLKAMVMLKHEPPGISKLLRATDRILCNRVSNVFNKYWYLAHDCSVLRKELGKLPSDLICGVIYFRAMVAAMIDIVGKPDADGVGEPQPVKKVPILAR
jgi:hypothetical protein